MRYAFALACLVSCLFSAPSATAQPEGEFFRSGYWTDGKAEFNTYTAKMVRYGVARDCEVTHIIVREPWDPSQLVKPDDWQRPGTGNVLKLNQILHIPTGMYFYQQMHSAFWEIPASGPAHLVKWSLTSNDGCGNTWKMGVRSDKGWLYEWRTYWDGMAGGEETVTPPEGAVFADELPLLVRALDFQKSSGELTMPLLPGVIISKKDRLQAESARLSWEKSKEHIVVKVATAKGAHRLVLETGFPHKLLEWSMPDGSSLKLRQSLKIDYWNRNQPADEELIQKK